MPRYATNKLDIIGMKFGNLTVISSAGCRNSKTVWNCLCGCGKTISVIGGSLKSGNTKSCGCLRKSYVKLPRNKISIGDCYGRLTVLSLNVIKGNRGYYHKCKCSCGSIKNILSSRLLSLVIRSCGCLHRETSAINGRNNRDSSITDTEREKLRLGRRSCDDTRLRRHAKKRFGDSCFVCNSKDSVEIHHLNSVSIDISKKYSLENCIPLCKCCHKEIHSVFGKRTFEDDFWSYVDFYGDTKRLSRIM